MTEFEANNSTRLKAFLKQLNELVDEYHPNLYGNYGVYDGLDMIITSIEYQLDKDKEI